MKGTRFGSRKDPSVGSQLPPDEGIVITHLGKGLAIESATGDIILCHTRRRLGDVAVGDRVVWQPIGDEQGRVIKVLPRKNVLARPGHNGTLRSVAANLDQVLIVVANEPPPDFLLADQYLAVCEQRDIALAFIFNKIDLVPDRRSMADCLSEYAAIGYGFFPVSARTGEGLAELSQALKDRCSLLAGQSGVGKSSLSNALLPDKQLRTRELSEKTGLGRHTTTAATLFRLPQGGNLIDSPGVAVFGLAQISARELAGGYREFPPHSERCQFSDCRHIGDKGCAVRAAVDKGVISKARYLRYLKLLHQLA